MPTSKSERGFATALTLAAGLCGLIVTLRHEWWRDEANPWLAARASKSIGELIAGIGFNGHPKPFYVLVWLLCQISQSPLMLSLANLACALGAIWLFAHAAPLSRAQRALFAFGFFPMWQYGVVARSYSLAMLLLFLYVWLRRERPERHALRLVVLAALAQVHVLATLAALSLGALEVFGRDPRRWTRSAQVGLGLLAASALATAWQVRPRDDHYRALAKGPALPWALANGFLPNFGVLYDWTWLQATAGMLLTLVALRALADDRVALRRWLLLSVPLAILCQLAYPGHRWHHGLYFIYFVTALWLSDGPRTARAAVITSALLAVQAAVGVYALAADAVGQYSNGHAIAAAMRAHGLERAPVLGVKLTSSMTFRWEIDDVQPVLLDLPDGRVYNPNEGWLEHYWCHYDQPRYFPDQPLTLLDSQLEQMTAALGRAPAVVVELAGEGAAYKVLPPSLTVVDIPPPAMDYGERLALFRYQP